MHTILQDERGRRALDLSDDALDGPALRGLEADDDIVTDEGICHD
jgi:hypothetical protein